MLCRIALFPVPLLLAACATTPHSPREAVAPVRVGIVAFNDFHGQLEPPRASVQAPDSKGGTIAVPAGGAAWLASAVKRVRGDYRHAIVVAAGDLIGGSPLASSLFLDEPAIGALNLIGLELSAVGNHEFDRGRDEILRMQNGGCAKFTRREPCQLERFAGARFRYLAASTKIGPGTGPGKTLFPATALRSFGEGRQRVRIGFIGLTTKATPRLVTPSGIAGLSFGDEAEAINREVPRLKAKGADAVVVLIHEGGTTADPPDPGGCNALSGDILPIIARLDPRVDAVVSGHTHWPYVCELPRGSGTEPLLLSSAGHYGRLVTDLRLDIDPRSRRVVAKHAFNIVVQSPAYSTSRETVANSDLFPRLEPDPDVAAYVARYVAASKDLANRQAGWLAGPAARGEAGRGGPLGSIIADAQLAASKEAGAEIAFTNPFGIRAPLAPAADGALTFGQLYAVQPFGNTLVTQTMTGAEVKAVLEQGFDAIDPVQALAPSSGFSYSVDLTRPAGDRVVAVTLDGVPLDLAREYRVTTNSFLAAGGDGFTVLARPRSAVQGMPDIEALEMWLKTNPPRAVPEESRVSGL